MEQRELRKKESRDSSLQSGIFRWLLKKGLRQERQDWTQGQPPHFGEGSFWIRIEKAGHQAPDGKKSYILTVTTWGPWADKEKQEPPEWQETTFGVISDLEADKGGERQESLASQCNLLLIMLSLQNLSFQISSYHALMPRHS